MNLRHLLGVAKGRLPQNKLDYIYHITKDGIGFNLLVRLLDGDSQSDSSKKNLAGGGRGIKLPGTKSKYPYIAIQEK